MQKRDDRCSIGNCNPVLSGSVNCGHSGGQVPRKALIVAGTTTVVSAALAIVINIATSDAPRWMEVLRPWVWLIAAFLVCTTAALTAWDRRVAGLEAARGPLPASGPEPAGGPRELPRDISCFRGRDEDLSELKHYARSRGIVTIAGKPGVGKSALAVHAAHLLRDGYPDGQVFVDLRGLRGKPLRSRDAMLHVIRAFDQADGLADGDIGARYRSVLARKRAILIFDDAEDEPQVRPLLPPDKRSLALITSRRALAALTEAPRPITLGTLSEHDAVSLLSELTGDQRIQRDIAKSEILVGQCGGLPLALRIVAARLRRHRHWTIGSLVERLEDERHRLDELRVADLEVRACIALSYTDLTPQEATWFRWLAIIPGRDFSPETAATALDLDPASALRALEELADAQLVELKMEDRAGLLARPRFGYHDLIRIFAEERLREEETPATRAGLLRRALAWYADQLDQVTSSIGVRSSIGPTPPSLPRGHVGASQQITRIMKQTKELPEAVPEDTSLEAESFRWLKAESDNLMPAVLASRDADPRISWRLARSLLLSSEGAFPVPELLAISQVADEAAGRLGDPDTKMAALYLRGRAERLNGQLREATRSLQESARYFSDTGKSAEAAEVLLNLGKVHRERHHLDEAAAALGRAYRLRRSTGDHAGAASVGAETAVLLKEHGRLKDAANVLECTIGWLTAASGPPASMSQLAWAHENLGAILKRLGRTQEAVAHHQESLRAFTETGNLSGQAHAWCNLGDLALGSSHLHTAEKSYMESRRIFRRARNRRGEAQALEHLALALLRERHILRCAGTLAKCLIVAQRAGYLRELLRQFRQYRSGNTGTQAAPVVSQALDLLAKAFTDA
jgi:tetratricopeptide (TPR) repeat protein